VHNTPFFTYYMKYFIEGLVVAILMILGLHYFVKQPWQPAILIGLGAAVLTVLNKVYLDRKQQKNKK